MKIAIIADNLGKNAPGVVFKNVLSGLFEKIDFDIITSTMDYQASPNHKGVVEIIKQKKIPSWRFRTLLFKIFGFYHTQKFWAQKIQYILQKGNYDIVISFMSSTFYASVMAADIYTSKSKTKHICYCVDAVPAPFPWEKTGLYSWAMKRFARKYMKNLDVLCMTNKEMLSYELEIIGNPNIKQVVLPNPPKESSFRILPIEDITPTFVYAGKMYGLRNPDALLGGFKMFLNNHPTAKMLFVGSGSLELYVRKNFADIFHNIEFISYTNDLSSIYRKCSALIDVNANINNDVFLSSKIISYLPFNRLIISESGKGSPVRSLFNTSNTIIHVHHKDEEYYKAMEYCFLKSATTDFSERNTFLRSMDINAVTNTLKKVILENYED